MKARAVAIRLALLLSVFPAAGQEVGAIEGRVRDEQGAAVYAATALILRDGAVERLAETDRLGFFRLTGLAPGSYQLRIARLGHTPSEQEVTVASGARLALEVVLSRAAIELGEIAVEAGRSRERARFEAAAGATVRELGIHDLRSIPRVAEADVLRAVEVLSGVVSTSDFSSAFPRTRGVRGPEPNPARRSARALPLPSGRPLLGIQHGHARARAARVGGLPPVLRRARLVGA